MGCIVLDNLTVCHSERLSICITMEPQMPIWLNDDTQMQDWLIVLLTDLTCK